MPEELLADLQRSADVLGTRITVLPPDGSDVAPVVIDGREAAEG